MRQYFSFFQNKTNAFVAFVYIFIYIAFLFEWVNSVIEIDLLIEVVKKVTRQQFRSVIILVGLCI